MLKFILIALVLIVGGVLVLAAFQPDSFRVQRKLAIKAPPEKIFPLIDNLHENARWQPYYSKDPQIKLSYSGPDSGPGAQVDFSGGAQVGSGRVSITGGEAPAKVDMRLQMLKPFSADNAIEFTLTPSGDSTEVSWTMQGQVPYPAKIMHLFFNMDRMVGGDFETGLANLKAIAES